MVSCLHTHTNASFGVYTKVPIRKTHIPRLVYMYTWLPGLHAHTNASFGMYTKFPIRNTHSPRLVYTWFPGLLVKSVNEKQCRERITRVKNVDNKTN